MKQYFVSLKEILMLRESPQVIPVHTSLMLLTVMISLSLGIVIGSVIYSFPENIGRPLFEAAILLLFVQFALQYFNHRERFTQTVTALFSVQVVLNLFSLPIVANLPSQIIQENIGLSVLTGLFSMCLLMYSVIVMSHILKFAFSIELRSSVFISIVYHFLSLLVSSLMFPTSAP